MTRANGTLYYATLHHLRGWLWFDQVELKMVAEAGGLTATSVRRIAVEYSVIRGMGSDLGEDAKANDKRDAVDGNAETLAKLLNDSLKKWKRADMSGRHLMCQELGRDKESGGVLRTNQVSAVTKLMWFLAPDDWTMFDTIVSRGMRKTLKDARPKEPRAGRRSDSQKYYDRLQLLGFGHAVREMRGILSKSVMPQLRAERIIDSYFLLMGFKAPEVQKRRLEHFLQGLPSDFQSAIDHLARQIDSQVRFPRQVGT